MSLSISHVLIADDLAPECATKLAAANIKVTTKTKLSKADLIKELQVVPIPMKCDAIVPMTPRRKTTTP